MRHHRVVSTEAVNDTELAGIRHSSVEAHPEIPGNAPYRSFTKCSARSFSPRGHQNSALNPWQEAHTVYRALLLAYVARNGVAAVPATHCPNMEGQLEPPTAANYRAGLAAEASQLPPYTPPTVLDATGTGALAVEYQRGPDMGGGVGGLLYSRRTTAGSSGGSPTTTVKFNLSNGRGDVVAQSDSAGTLTWTASYEAYGQRPVETGTNADRQRANTKEEDPTGLLNEGFRYRDIETGVWLSRDPAGFVDGPNLYAYVRQNPWTKWDPLGLAPELSPEQNVVAFVTDDTQEGDKLVWQSFFATVDITMSARSNEELVRKAEMYVKKSGRTIDVLAASGHAAHGLGQAGVKYKAMHPNTEKRKDFEGLVSAFSNEQLTDKQVGRLSKLLSPSAEIILASCDAGRQQESMSALANRFQVPVHACQDTVLQGPDAGLVGPVTSLMKRAIFGLGVVEDPWVVTMPAPRVKNTESQTEGQSDETAMDPNKSKEEAGEKKQARKE